MSPDTEEVVVEEGEPVEPIGHVRVVYLGPVAPHWEVQSDYGPPEVIDQFRERVLARLVLLPPHDPQFRRNSERVVRDAEREFGARVGARLGRGSRGLSHGAAKRQAAACPGERPFTTCTQLAPREPPRDTFALQRSARCCRNVADKASA